MFRNLSGTVALLSDNQPVYLVYTALLTQSGTDVPSAIVLENTTGSVLTFYRSDVGEYYVELSNGYSDINKVTLSSTINSNNGHGGFMTYEGSKYGASSSPYLYFNTWSIVINDMSDDLLFKSFFEIRIYN